MTANQFRLVCSFVLTVFVGIASCHADKPNIVIVYADDMGCGDCTAYNSESKIPTPNIDRLAKEGMRFTDAHSPGATCTASRYGLLTGISPVRTGVLNGTTSTGPAIERSETTIAQMLKDQGYATNMIGKWHLGFDIPKGQRRCLSGSPAIGGFWLESLGVERRGRLRVRPACRLRILQRLPVDRRDPGADPASHHRSSG